MIRCDVDRLTLAVCFFGKWWTLKTMPLIIHRRTQKLRNKSLYAQLLKNLLLFTWTTFLRWDIEWDFNRSGHVLTKVFKIISTNRGIKNELAKLFYSRKAAVCEGVHIWSNNSCFGQELKWWIPYLILYLIDLPLHMSCFFWQWASPVSALSEASLPPSCDAR